MEQNVNKSSYSILSETSIILKQHVDANNKGKKPDE